MGEHRDTGHVFLQGGDPYKESLQLENDYISYEQEICPRCGSRHITTFNNIVSNQNDGNPISGDLRFGTLVVGKCLSCGKQVPMKFRCIREA